MSPVISRHLRLFFFAFLLMPTPGWAAIFSFTANPATFLPGQEVTLSWSATAGDGLSIDQGVGALAATTGSVKVIPNGLTTYSLTDTTSGTTAPTVATPVTATVLTHRWGFNETNGVIVNDAVGSSNGALINATSGTNWTRTNAAGGSTTPDRVKLPGGSSANAPYIDLPNGIMTGLTKFTYEGWVTLHGAQTWARIFDFGTNGVDQAAPGGSLNGTEYITLAAQVGGAATTRRISMKDNGVENYSDFTDSVTYGTEFHFACVYDPAGNSGAPRLSYYKNGVLTGTLNTAFRPQDIVYLNNWLGRSNFNGDSNTNASYNEFRIWSGPLSTAALSDTIAAGPDALPQAVRIDSFTAFPATTIYEGKSARLSYLLANPSGGAFTASIDQGVGTLPGASGFVTVSPTASKTYTLTVSAGATTRTAQVLINVVPTAPTVESLTVIAKYQTAIAVTLVGYDYSAAPALTYSIVSAPTHGTLSGTAPNFTYTPAAGFSGADGFTYKANNGLDSNVATVTLAVASAPVPPASVTLSETSLFTDLLSGSFAARLQTVDANTDDTFTYALVGGAGSTHNGYFSVAGNQLIAAHNFSADLNQAISIRLRVTDSAGNSLEQIVSLPVAARPAHVRINEINYNPARNTQLSEFLELYNPTGASVDLSNWRLAKAVDFVFPAGTTLPAGGYLVIAENPATIQALYGVAPLGPWTGGLSSDGEEIDLRDALGATVDKVNYGNTAPWPAPPNGDGPSLELLNPALDNGLGGNWRASTVTQSAITYVAAGSGAWRYRKGTSEASAPIAAWRAAGFSEDATWLTGTLPIGLFKLNNNTPLSTLPETGVTLGTQLTDMANYVSSNANSATNFSVNYRSVFLRKTFTVSGPIPRSVLLRVMHNDAAIVWINGVEVARFGFHPSAPADPPFNNTAYYELANDPWSETVLLNAGALLQQGTNLMCIEGFAKPPQIRSAQDDVGTYNLFDFSVDATLRSSPDILGTPGAQNSVFTAAPPPAVRDVNHVPKSPKPWEAITVTARVSDAQGVGSVQLKYQVNLPGAYVPSTVPLTVSQLLLNPTQNLPANAAFETGWTTIPMVDDGTVAGDIPGDGVFTARIPAQPHRTLVRYRIVAADLGGASVTVPSVDDPRKNYAWFVYNRVPIYTVGAQVFAPATLNTLPVYQWIARPADMTALMAYNASDQFANTAELNVLLARRYENFEGTLVVGDQVLDHVHVRLRGGNSRYQGSGKRHFRFNFAKGTSLEAEDEAGRKYNRPWEAMLFNKLFGNKGAYDWGLPYEVGSKLWQQQGTPMPDSHWVQFRVVQNANENDAASGDFWGLYQALELPEGKNYLRSRQLPLGNFYKMSDWTQNSDLDQRYQAPGAVDFGEDFDNIRYNLHQYASQSDLERYMNMPLWYRYDAVKEAIRHYDIFCEPTGRHRVKNLIWYFAPMNNTNGLGQLVQMPYDWDASFGPNWNSGWDFVHNALYDHADVNDSPTWPSPAPAKLDRTAMRIEHRNVIRELRDLVWYRGSNGRGPLDDLIDDAAATISAFAPADQARWPSPGSQIVYAGGVPAKVADMKAFAFTGWTDTAGNGDPAVGAGGRAAYLDSISDALDAGQLPAKPTLSYSGTAGYPVDTLSFTSSAFSDPQGSSTAGAAIQWRIGEVTDPAAPAYDAAAERIYEAVPVFDTGALTVFNASYSIPGTALRIGHTYRARVRHRDNTGRFGHWSEPVQFTPGTSNYLQTLKDNLTVSEVMYHPAPPAAGYAEADYEYMELLNTSPSLSLDLANVRFTKGVDFNFAGSAVTTLAPGARVLIVKNMAAFISRHGSGKPIAGQWDTADSLSNNGEEVKLSYGAGAVIKDFTYDDAAPWPTKADLGGYSLVLSAPETHPDPADWASWRASYVAGGSPGSADRQTYTEWATANAAGDPLADDDFDGLSNALEYALGGTNTAANATLLPTSGLGTFTVGVSTDKYLMLTLRRPLAADQAGVSVEWATDLLTPNWSVSGALVSSSENVDGTRTDVWRSPTPLSGGRCFGRLKIVLP